MKELDELIAECVKSEIDGDSFAILIELYKLDQRLK